LSGDERIRDAYLGGGEHGDEMTFGDRPLNVDTNRPLRARSGRCLMAL
jgi:hypothetical protein